MINTTPREPDLLDELAEIVPVVFSVLEYIDRSEASVLLSIAKSDVALWAARDQTQRRLCSEVARCANRNCRRRRYCRKLRWIAFKEKAARAHLEDVRAKLPESQREPSGEHKKKGRTGVRP